MGQYFFFLLLHLKNFFLNVCLAVTIHGNAVFLTNFVVKIAIY